MSKKDRPKNPGRPAKPAYPNSIAHCDHAGGPGSWQLDGGVIRLYTCDPELTPETDPNRELAGYLLNVSIVRCQLCGQRFRFMNLPTSGDQLQLPLMKDQNRAMQTPIEPDRRIVSPIADGKRLIMAPGGEAT